MNLREIVARPCMGLWARLRNRALLPAPASLPPPQTRLLLALWHGGTLKSHRYLDGAKEYRLHPLNGEAISVAARVVRSLEAEGCLLSNLKFPVATLMLSARGRIAAQAAIEATEPAPTADDMPPSGSP